MTIRTTSVIGSGTMKGDGPRRPFLPGTVAYTILEDHGDSMVVDADEPLLALDPSIIAADGVTIAVASIAAVEPVTFVVDGAPVVVEPEGDEVARLEVSADAPGVISISIAGGDPRWLIVEGTG